MTKNTTDISLFRVKRKEKKITQLAFSKTIGIHRDTLIDIEKGRGNPSLAVMEAICGELGLEVRICFK